MDFGCVTSDRIVVVGGRTAVVGQEVWNPGKMLDNTEECHVRQAMRWKQWYF
jgi:hypothetical protein